jgi:hypothetical protein
MARVLDAGIVVMLALIALRIGGAQDMRGMIAGYLVMAGIAATVPIFLAALSLGIRRR